MGPQDSKRQQDQAQNKRMCPYNSKKGGGSRLYHLSRAVETMDKSWSQKRTRVKCPECGRRMWGWATISHDAEIVHYSVPPHKRKRWWRIARGEKKDAK